MVTQRDTKPAAADIRQPCRIDSSLRTSKLDRTGERNPRCSDAICGATREEDVPVERRVVGGAFKLFVYLCLKADRSTGELTVSPTPVGSGLTQGSLFTYLGELQSRGLLQLSLARNQHERTHIQISEPFWPYRRSLVQEPEAAESQYLDQVARLLLEAPGVQCSFSPRPIGSWPLNGHTGGPITSLNYFEPLIQEVRQQPVSDQ